MGQEQSELTPNATPAEEPKEEPKTVEELRGEIEATREHLGETLDAIGEKLSPAHIKAEVAEKVREQTVGRAQKGAKTLGEQAQLCTDFMRRNPWPVLALLCLPVAWGAWQFSQARRTRRASWRTLWR